MRRLLATYSAVGLLCSAVGCNSATGLLCAPAGCHSCNEHTHIAGRCDCDEPGYGCHYDMYYSGHAAAPTPVAPAPEKLKALPKDAPSKEDGN